MFLSVNIHDAALIKPQGFQRRLVTLQKPHVSWLLEQIRCSHRLQDAEGVVKLCMLGTYGRSPNLRIVQNLSWIGPWVEMSGSSLHSS